MTPAATAATATTVVPIHCQLRYTKLRLAHTRSTSTANSRVNEGTLTFRSPRPGTAIRIDADTVRLR
jgi:hypothetical protein